MDLLCKIICSCLTRLPWRFFGFSLCSFQRLEEKPIGQGAPALVLHHLFQQDRWQNLDEYWYYDRLPAKASQRQIISGSQKLLPHTQPAWSLLRLEVFWDCLSWIVVKNLFSVVKNDDFFLPGDTSQHKPILFSTATELELGPGVAESPTSKLIRMEFKVRSEHGSVWFLAVSISTIWKLEVLITPLIPYVYTVCVVDNKCSGVLSSWYQSCKWHGVTTSALVKQPFLPGLKTQAAWASWSWPSGATDFYSKSANPSKLAFSVSQSFPNFCPVVPLDQDLNAAIAML